MAKTWAGVFGGLLAAPHPPAPPASAPARYQSLPLRDPQIFDLFGHSGEMGDVRQVHPCLLVIPINESYAARVPGGRY
ncbi:MAG: hypothetical protein ABR579_06475 [Actinomycetota bacterium]